MDANLLRSLLSPIRDSIFGLWRKPPPLVGPFYEVSNLTKWRVLKPFHEELGGTCLIPHLEGQRIDALLAALREQNVAHCFVSDLPLPTTFWKFFFRFWCSEQDGGKGGYFRARHAAIMAAKVSDLPRNGEFYFCSNDDLAHSVYWLKELRSRGAVVVNVMHGKVYGHPIVADALVGFCESQLAHASLLLVGKARTEKIRIFSQPELLRPKVLRRLFFFDQPVCDALPESVYCRALGDMCALKEEFPHLDIRLVAHPASLPVYHAKWAEKGIPMARKEEEFDLGVTVCSTVGWDNFARSKPTLYLNYGDILSGFKHIEPFLSYSVDGIDSLRQLVGDWLGSLEAFARYSESQFNALSKQLSDALNAVEIIESLNRLQRRKN